MTVKQVHEAAVRKVDKTQVKYLAEDQDKEYTVDEVNEMKVKFKVAVYNFPAGVATFWTGKNGFYGPNNFKYLLQVFKVGSCVLLDDGIYFTLGGKSCRNELQYGKICTVIPSHFTDEKILAIGEKGGSFLTDIVNHFGFCSGSCFHK